MGQKIKAIFSKKGDMRFISHLDLVRLFQRAVRRADLAVTVTKGFSPHLKISLVRALKLGVESSGEEAIFYMDRETEPKNFMDRLNEKLPDGVRILDAKEAM